MRRGKPLLLALLALLIIGAWALDIGRWLNFETLVAHVGDWRAWREARPLPAALLFFGIYVVVTALSLPGAAIMTLAGGALFGFWQALVLVSFASTIGATLAFLVSRLLLRDWVQGRFGAQLARVNAGFSRDGPFYLFSLRLVPVFPFFIINLLAGLLPIGAGRFYWVSQLGMLPATAVYVNAGTRLGELEGPGGILSPPLLVSFLLLAVFPYIARALLRRVAARRKLANFQRPKTFDRDVVVIGAGSAGLVSALIAATLRARVTLVEKHRMGGDCLNTGCVPSKALLRSGHLAADMRRAPEFGLESVPVRADFRRVMERVQATIAAIEPHDSVERFTGLGVDCRQGVARIRSPWEVEIDGEVLTTRRIIIAAGARARVPALEGLADLDYLTSDTLWEIRDLPRRLLVIGAGPIGCELAQALAALGAEVTLLTHAERILPREDREASTLLAAVLEEQGVQILTGCEPLRVGRAEAEEAEQYVCYRGRDGQEHTLSFDRLLLAVGRTPNTEELGLAGLGIGTTPGGTLEIDEGLQTAVPTIYACGDIVGPYQFTHAAAHQAWYATVNALFGEFRRFRVDYSVMPWATFTHPEVARVGLIEAEAQARGIPVEVTRYDLDEHDRAIADGEARGFVKVLTAPGRDRILGVTIVGARAGDLLAEFTLAMKHGLGLNKILGTVHIYPTMSESARFAAGEWRKARKPERLLDLLERYHAWRRGA